MRMRKLVLCKMTEAALIDLLTRALWLGGATYFDIKDINQLLSMANLEQMTEEEYRAYCASDRQKRV